jgi:hypothetical protein
MLEGAEESRSRIEEERMETKLCSILDLLFRCFRLLRLFIVQTLRAC